MVQREVRGRATGDGPSVSPVGLGVIEPESWNDWGVISQGPQNRSSGFGEKPSQWRRGMDRMVKRHHRHVPGGESTA